MMLRRSISALPLLLLVFFTFAQSNAQVRRNAGYTAAVVEFSPVESLTDPPSLILAVNLGEYEKFIIDAKGQGADIIVFPEYALTGTSPSDNRSLAREFAQIVPEPELAGNPCLDNNTALEFEAMRRLSCYARASSIYLVVNLLEKSPCQGCAADNLLVFNANVAFDRTGTVVARYRKFNLFAEFALNQTAEADIAIFTSDWGTKFGLITCFDIMFEHPAVTLVQKHDVTNLIFPTAWIQELPFLTAVQAQSSWAVGMNITLLASGYNRPEAGNTGSGIYAGIEHGALNTYMAQEAGSKLLVATIPSKTPRLPETDETFLPVASPTLRKLYTTKDILDKYSSISLPIDWNIESKVSVCNGMLCCNLTYNINRVVSQFNYQLLAYDGIRTHANGLYATKMQVCALVACSGDTKTSCADGLDESLYSLQTDFAYLLLTGTNFKTSRLYPNTLLSENLNPILPYDYNFKVMESEVENMFNVTLEMKDSIKGVHTFGIYTHDYEPNNSSSMLNALPLLIISLFTSVLLQAIV